MAIADLLRPQDPAVAVGRMGKAMPSAAQKGDIQTRQVRFSLCKPATGMYGCACL